VQLAIVKTVLLGSFFLASSLSVWKTFVDELGENRLGNIRLELVEVVMVGTDSEIILTIVIQPGSFLRYESMRM
jgi:hypothetical protein